MKSLKVLSLFDGCAMAYNAISKSKFRGTPVMYYASEIDKYASKVADARVPFYRNMGDVRLVSGYQFDQFDLLIGGSPCTNLSSAGNGKGLEGEASSLFWEYVRIKNEGRFKYFLLENVASMKNADRDRMSEAMGCQPIRINSNLFSAQNRDRYYWTNIPVDISQLPEFNANVLMDVIIGYADPNDNAIKYFLSEKAMAYMERKGLNNKSRYEFMPNRLDSKSSPITANCWKGVPYLVVKELGRRLTPYECERLQTLPTGWTDVEGVSESQRYKQIGNGFTVSVITWILNFIPKENE